VSVLLTERTEVLEGCVFLVMRFSNEHVLSDPGGVAGAIPAVLRTATP
jgi:very-short-patch-repair endonuclease